MILTIMWLSGLGLAVIAAGFFAITHPQPGETRLASFGMGFGFFSVFGSVALGFLTVVLFLGTEIFVDEEREPVVVSQQKLLALKDNSQLEGDFFLGTGSVGEKSYYVGYVDYGSHVRQQKWPTSRYKIKFDESNPRVEVVKYRPTNPKCDLWPCRDLTGPKVIYVPRDSIINEFVLDAE